MEAMARHRSHSIAFKRQVAQEFVSGETLHSLAKRHDLSRNLIRLWVQKYEAGALDEDATAADMIQEYEARIAALERLVGKQALELKFLRGRCGTHRGREHVYRRANQAQHDAADGTYGRPHGRTGCARGRDGQEASPERDGHPARSRPIA